MHTSIAIYSCIFLRQLNGDKSGTDNIIEMDIEQKVEELTRRLNEFENSLVPINGK